jgi:L-lactate dehydrogenase
MTEKSSRVAVIGTGNVGATFAYGLLMNTVANEVMLIDVNRDKAEGEAMDLDHALPFMRPTKISVGKLNDCAGSDVVVITAGAGRKPGETRLDLAKKNTAMFRTIIPQIAGPNSNAIFVIASNPVDVLTYVMVHDSGLPARQVIGSGTILDTARFRALLSQYFGVDPRSVHGHIIGEHGDTEVPVWSLANIAGMRLPKLCENRGMKYDKAALENIFVQTRDAGAAVIQRKGATFYAIASALVKIVASILRNQNTVLTVSSLINNYYGISDVCLSLPTVINRSGIQEVLRLELEPAEVEMLRNSADVLRANIAGLETERQVMVA